RLLRYVVRDPRGRAGGAHDDLVAQLALSQHTFFAARPFLTVTGQVGTAEPSLLTASDPTDPERFASLLLQGAWLSKEGDARQVVLSRALAKELFPDASPVGSLVSVRFRRKLAAGREEEIAIPLRVVGVSGGRTSFALE